MPTKLEQFIAKRKKNKQAQNLDFKGFFSESVMQEAGKIWNELKPTILSEIRAIVEAKIYDLVKNVEKGDKGDKGDKGEKPVFGIDYKIPKDGRNAIMVSSNPPLNPQKGDLWYKEN